VAAFCLGAGDGGQLGLRDVLLMMARVSGEEIWRAVFDKFDMDGDGFVTRGEYIEMMTQIYGGQSPSDEEVDATFQAADDDRDGRISYDGIVLLTAKRAVS